ncbi:MAG TPA: hypothetical protein PKA58_25815, partial [Polyangium sp.]|nr:hypothetical protein [Polyangium sp.]
MRRFVAPAIFQDRIGVSLSIRLIQITDESVDTFALSWDSRSMYEFVRFAPLDITPFNDPGMENRSGPPLTRGSLFMLLGTVAGEALGPDAHAVIRRLDVDSWYQGQLLETLLNMLEEHDPELPEFVGRNIYFMFRTPLQQVGINTATDLVKSMTGTWVFATRGDSGEFRSRMIADRHWIVEGEQPYNCLFEGGALRGFIEAFD